MAIPKYRHLIKPLNIGAINWEETKKAAGQPAALAIGPGNASREVRLNGPDHLQGLNLNFSWGVHTGCGDWHAGLDPHVHPYPECLMFTGLDTANINYLGAEITCCLGSEQETYTFNEPTVIIIPTGLPHGPISTKRMYSPKGFGFLAVELNPVTEITWLGEGVSRLSAEQRNAVPKGLTLAAAEKILRNEPIPATGKYDHLVKSLRSGLRIERGEIKPEHMARHGEKSQKPGQKRGPGNADHLAWMCGKDLQGLDVTISWGFHSQPGAWQRGIGSHVHRAGEVMVYAGTGTDSVDDLGAEIEIDMGEEHERYLINKPTLVVCPAGLAHNPQVTRWVDKPFAFFAISLSGEQEFKSFD